MTDAFIVWVLLSQHDSATSLLDLLLGSLGEEAGLDDYGAVRKAALAKHLEISMVRNVNDWGFITIVGGASLVADERPQAVYVDLRGVELILLVMEVALTNLTEVSWMAERSN